MHRIARALPFLLCIGLASPAGAYPLDGYADTGIIRLVAYRLAAQGVQRPSFLVNGALLPSDAVQLSLEDQPAFELPAADTELSRQIRELLGGDASAYGLTVLDITDPTQPRYAAHNPWQAQLPGSVGKILVATAFFQALADHFPDEDERHRLLYDTQITANGFIRNDAHDVPIWSFGQPSVERKPIVEGDTANLWTFLDWMMSASSNAAAAMMQSQVALLDHFGKEYPVSEERAAAYFRDTSKNQLTRSYVKAIESPVTRNGLDLDRLRQGSFFTREGKNRIPGSYSTSTAGEIMRWMVKMEQGQLVDPWSSLQIKKLLYLTDVRIRYAAHPALADSAVYFKSGSLYSCKEEKGFDCGKFRGNRKNYMNSVVMVESTDRNPKLRYIVVLLSNVLRKDSAETHQQLGAQIQKMMEDAHPTVVERRMTDAPAGM